MSMAVSPPGRARDGAARRLVGLLRPLEGGDPLPSEAPRLPRGVLRQRPRDRPRCARGRKAAALRGLLPYPTITPARRPGRNITFRSFTTSWSFQEELHRLREHLALEGAALRLDVVEGVFADADLEDVLQDHRPRIELLGDEVRGAARDAHALFPRLAVGVRPGVVGEQRGVDVDDPERVAVDHSLREDLHVA